MSKRRWALLALALGLSGMVQPVAHAQEEEPRQRLLVTVTGYCLQGTMRNGEWVHDGAVATDPNVIPLGSRLTIDGLGGVYTAKDTGGGVRGEWVDVWFPTCGQALEWGRQTRLVEVW